MQAEKWLTLKELSDYLKIGRTTIYQMARAGNIPASRIGNLWRFDKSVIDKWMQGNQKRSFTKATSRNRRTGGDY